jgi:hypothetical protein
MMTTPSPSHLPLTHSPSEYAETLPPRFRALYLRATSGHRPSARKAMCLSQLGKEVNT